MRVTGTVCASFKASRPTPVNTRLPNRFAISGAVQPARGPYERALAHSDGPDMPAPLRRPSERYRIPSAGYVAARRSSN